MLNNIISACSLATKPLFALVAGDALGESTSDSRLETKQRILPKHLIFKDEVENILGKSQ